MLNIKHFPIFDTEVALEHYKSEGVKYVCTTELKAYGIPIKNVHGHIHQNPSPPGPYKCVCVEQINYTPINIEELK